MSQSSESSVVIRPSFDANRFWGFFVFITCLSDILNIYFYSFRASGYSPKKDIKVMNPKRGRGRPRMADDEKRKPAFLIKLTDEENAMIREALAGEKITTWAREVLLRAAKRRQKV